MAANKGLPFIIYYYYKQLNSNQIEMQQNIGQYTILWNEEIGMGNFASVFKCLHNQTQVKHAAKVLQKVKIEMDQTLKQSFDDELSSLQTPSEHIVKFIDLLQCKTNYYIVQELCDCNLRQYIKQNPNLTEKESIRILTEIAIGMYSLVKLNITHRDLKPQNILLKGQKVKIADFGVSKKNEHNKCYFDCPAGSITYMSLEALKGEKYTSKCDIWSIGLIFYQLLHGECPWYRQGDNKASLIKKIEQQPLKIKPNLEDNTRNFLKRCLALKEENRCDWKKFFGHPIFEGRFNDYQTHLKKCQKRMGKIYTHLANLLANQNMSLSNCLQLFSTNQQLNFNQFFKMLVWGDKTTEQFQARYIFEETDFAQDGIISIDQIQIQINIQSKASIETTEKDSRKEAELKISNNNSLIDSRKDQIHEMATREKILTSFKKTCNLMKMKGEKIEDIFHKHSNNSASITKDQFVKLIKKCYPQLTENEANQLFLVLSCNNAIEYSVFNYFYEKVIKMEESYGQIKLRHKESCPQTYQSCMNQFNIQKQQHHCNFKKSKTSKEIEEETDMVTQSSKVISSDHSKIGMKRRANFRSVHSSIIHNENDDDWAI